MSSGGDGTRGGGRVSFGEKALILIRLGRVGLRQAFQQAIKGLLARPHPLGMIWWQTFVGSTPGEPADPLETGVACRGEQQIGIFQPPDRRLGAFAIFGRNRHLKQAGRTADRLESLTPKGRVGGLPGHRGERTVTFRARSRSGGQARECFGTNRLDARPARHFGHRARRGKESESALRFPEIPIVGSDLDE